MKRALSPENMNLDAFPPELWVHTLTHLTPPHFPKFALICTRFNEIYKDEGIWKELFQSHFSTCQPREGESWKAAYQREYRFPLCEIRTKWKEIKSIPLPFEVHCAQVHNDCLFLGGQSEIGMLNLKTCQWIKPLTILDGHRFDHLVVNKIDGVRTIFTSYKNNVVHYRQDGDVLRIKTRFNTSEEYPICALGLSKNHFTCLTEESVLLCFQIGETGELIYKQGNKFVDSVWELFSSTLSNDRLMVSTGNESMSVYDAVSCQFIEKFDVPDLLEHVFLVSDKLHVSDKLIIMSQNDNPDVKDFKISVVDLNTKNMFTRKSSQEEQSYLSDMYRLFTYSTQESSRVLGLKTVDYQGQKRTHLQILECTPE